MNPVSVSNSMTPSSLPFIQDQSNTITHKPGAFNRLERLISTPQQEPMRSQSSKRNSAFTNITNLPHSAQGELRGFSPLKGIIPRSMQQPPQKDSSSTKRKLDEGLEETSQKKKKISEMNSFKAIIDVKIPNEGKVFRADGTLWYNGQYEFEKPHGFGTSYHKDGVTVAYVGSWIHGETHGFGKKFFPDRSCEYIGQLQHGKAQGYGKIFQPDGTIAFDGQWENGKFVG